MALNLWKYNGYNAAEKYTLEENQYAGRVIRIDRGQSYQIMSDIWGTADWATVLDEENKPKRICMNIYDMGAPEHLSTGEVDATEEVKDLYRRYFIELHVASKIGQAEIDAQQIEKNCTAKVVKGRNGKGTVGQVVVMMDATYGMGWQSRVEKKLAIATSDVKIKKAFANGKIGEVFRDVVWVWARNCVRVDIAPVDKDAIRAQVEAMATDRLVPNW